MVSKLKIRKAQPRNIPLLFISLISIRLNRVVDELHRNNSLLATSRNHEVKAKKEKKGNAQRGVKINPHLYDTEFNLYRKDIDETKKDIKEVGTRNPEFVKTPEVLDPVMREFLREA